MATTPETRDRGDGIAAILALLGVPGLISFAGGFPDPATFPRERAATLLAEFAASGETSAFQYAPTRGLAGPLDAVASRLEATQGRRPADDELLIASGGTHVAQLGATDVARLVDHDPQEPGPERCAAPEARERAVRFDVRVLHLLLPVRR